MNEREIPPEGAEPEGPLVARPALRRGFLSVRTLLSFAIAAALLVLVWFLNDLSIEEILDRLSRANPWLIVAAFVVYASNFPLRTLRWRILLNNA
ncbi:MAG: lysylphosphatidylglycerol synthase domain-containing protein, partial [Chloroflexi bacterium]|nr:lysylphosphatidylglycerol synthase domain-containing protein [Chloroflexota bacterium]